MKRLEQAGLVDRKRNPSDERQVKVLLTDKGRALRAETRLLTDALYERAGASVAELTDLNLRIRALRDAFRAADPRQTP